MSLLALALALFTSPPVQASPKASATNRCLDDPAYHMLDFWLGDWEVFDSQDGSKSGTNKIYKAADGCALIEDWHDPDGSQTIGFLYFEPARKQWKYVLISHGGGIKERVIDADFSAAGSIRFQGEILHVNSPGSHLDRMTLIPLPDHRIRETIEISRDQGKTWELAFDAQYRRAKRSPR